MICSFIYLFFICIMVSIKSTSTKNIVLYPKLYSHIETKYSNNLSNQDTDNLKLTLNFIQNTPEFHPLVFSIVRPEFQSNLVDFLMKHIVDNSIEVYTVGTIDLPWETTWINRIKLTWVIVVQDLYSLYIYIYWQPKLWNSNHQYLIIFLGEDTIESWIKVFRNLWTRYSVYRAVVVSIQDDFRCLIKYMPFDPRGDDFGAVYKLCLNEFQGQKTLRDADEVQRPQTPSGLFENFQNLRNYPINVIAFESLLMDITYDDENRPRLSNLDANVLYTLEKAIGAKFLIKAMRKRDFRPEDPFSVSLRSIESGNAEMVITGFFVKVYSNFQEFRFTRAVYEDKLCFLSPDSGLVPKAYMPFLPFHKQVWMLLVTYNIGIAFIWCLTTCIDERLRHPSRKPEPSSVHLGDEDKKSRKTSCRVRSVFKAGATRFRHLHLHLPKITRHRAPPEIPRYLTSVFNFLEILCYPLQKGRSLTQNSLLLAALFFSLIVNGLYQSILVSSLNKPFHYPQLRSIEDVVESGKPVITRYPNLKSVFVDDSPLDRKLNERIQVIDSSMSTKDIVAYGDKISITRYYSMVLGNYSYFDKDGNDLLHVVDECPMNYRVSYVLRLDSPYAERVDFVLLKLREAGLLASWFEQKLYPVRIVKLKRKLKMDKRKKKLTLGHYSLTFLMLFGGLFCSVLTFLCECYAGKVVHLGNS